MSLAAEIRMNDDFDQIEDSLVTAKKLKKPSNGSRSYMKYGMVDNLEPIPKNDGRIVTFFSCLRFPNEPF